MQELTQYRGQWGGRTETGEEMWWSEPDPGLAAGRGMSRLRFAFDVRQYFLLRFIRKALETPLRSALPKIADFGCGTGGTTLNFSSFLGVSIDGYDIFETQLAIGREFARKMGSACRFRTLESGKIPVPDGHYDVIVSADVLGHVPDVRAVLGEWSRALRPGGSVALFTEAAHSPGDRSVAARLAREGLDLAASVPEHISLHPREALEKMFGEAGFEFIERYSANVAHFFFFPKDYVLILERHGRKGPLLWLARAWNRLTKVTPFYPWPFQALRLAATYLFGGRAYGTGYFYLLTRR